MRVVIDVVAGVDEKVWIMSFGCLLNDLDGEEVVVVVLVGADVAANGDSSGGLSGLEWRDLDVSGGGNKLYVFREQCT